ncbi:MAG: hypothetical protein IH899_22405 [Planctomycetes bacterium]|nr:hypothetical protein [Planctomycetota bacterium]
MDADRETREEKKKELLRQLAELTVEEQVEEGLFLETPHYSIIERVAMNLGRDLSRQTQERAAREVAANCRAEEPCPTCGAPCSVESRTRDVISLDGTVELTEGTASCKKCRRSFFPSARRVGV